MSHAIQRDMPWSMTRHGDSLQVLGWREWCALPELGIAKIKCKVDTGARTSALHAFFVESFRQGGKDMVRFGIHPLQRRTTRKCICCAEIADRRVVADSGGHREQRVVITTPIVLGDQTWPIEITLTDRDTMMFRMLLGRTAINKRYLVNSARSYLVGQPCVVMS